MGHVVGECYFWHVEDLERWALEGFNSAAEQPSLWGSQSDAGGRGAPRSK